MKYKEIRKRWTGLGLAIALSLSSVVPAAADPGEAATTVSAMQEQEATEVFEQNEEAAANDGSSEVVAEDTVDSTPNDVPSQEPESDVNAESGNVDSISSEEISTDADAEETIEITAENSASETDKKPVIEIKDIDGTEKNLTIIAGNIKKTTADEVVKAAVWSAEKGQDDLKWYDLSYSQSEDVYKNTINIANHKSNGLYYVHLYIMSKSGNTYLGDSNFQITPATAEKIEVTDISSSGSVITISGVHAPSGIKEVTVPVWSTSNQSDICWYKAAQIADGTYQVKMDLSKHGYHYGKYHIHVYATNGIGAQSFVISDSCEINRGEISLEAIPADNGYTLKASNLDLSIAESVKFAVWSANNGQDDLVWLDMKPSASGTVSVKWLPKEFGDYYIHCYIRTKSGQMVFQKDLTLNIKGPKIGKMDITSDINTGAFSIVLSDVEESALIKKVTVPVWSDPKQADIVWYDAVKQADGTYRISSNISKHKYNVGTYHAHVYMTDARGSQTFQLGDSFKFEASSSSVTVSEKESSEGALKTYTASAENVVIPGGATAVSFAVWSADKGQDDIVWYKAVQDGTTWTTPIQLSKHLSAGKFYVHCYADTKTGSKVFLGATEFTVNLSAKASVSVLATDDKAGTITLQIHVDEKSDEIDKLLVPVWVNADKSDLYTYTADKAAEDTWTVTVNASNHKYNFGTYSVHVDAHFTLGLSVPAADFTTDFKPAQFLSVEKTGNGKRVVKISNVSSSAKKVTFPTWSNTDGQDDIVWYTGTKNTDGSWSAEITSANLKHSGKVITHCYVDDVFAGSIESEFTAEEMETVGSRKVHQYAQQLIAANGGDLYRIYKWVVNSYRYTTKPVPVPYPSGYTRQEFYFTDAYETKVTNCFGFAATFYWCAKEMGYDVKLIEGRVRYRSGAYGPHGWVEVYKNGATYICDPELEYEKSINSYMVTYASSPFSYQPTMPAY